MAISPMKHFVQIKADNGKFVDLAGHGPLDSSEAAKRRLAEVKSKTEAAGHRFEYKRAFHEVAE